MFEAYCQTGIVRAQTRALGEALSMTKAEEIPSLGHQMLSGEGRRCRKQVKKHSNISRLTSERGKYCATEAANLALSFQSKHETGCP